MIEQFWDFAGGEKELKRSIELRPNYAPAFHWHSLLLIYLRRHEEALSEEMKALELDPYSRVINMGLALLMADFGKYQESMERLKKVLQANPDFSAARFWKTYVHVYLGELEAAIEEAKGAISIDGAPIMRLNLAWVYAEAGRKDDAKRILEEVLSETTDEYVRPAQVGMVELAMGDKDEGYRWLEKGLLEKDSALLLFGSIPWFKKYQADARWVRIDERLGLR
jgi:tetratricopeptide (TPR) repeat protein